MSRDSDSAQLLFTNDAFYQAFRDRDMTAMQALWAEEQPIACLHPGWQPLIGRQDVLESWAAILANPESPEVHCRGAKVLLWGETGLVLCYESIGGQFLAASNLFAREGGAWRLVHHQAGPCQPPEALPEDKAGPPQAH